MLFLFNRNKFAQLIIDVISRASFARRLSGINHPESTDDFFNFEGGKKKKKGFLPHLVCIGCSRLGCVGGSWGVEALEGALERGCQA